MIQCLNCPMVRLLMSEVKNSDVLKLFSSLWLWESKCQASMKLPINPFWSVMLISEKICTPTLSWVVELPCSQEFLKDWARKWPLWPHPPWRSRFWPLKRESSWSGSVDLFCHLFQLSKPCGSLRPSIKKLEPPSYTENVSDCWIIYWCVKNISYHLYFFKIFKKVFD